MDDTQVRGRTMAASRGGVHAFTMPDLNNANPTPPEDTRAKLRQAEEESHKQDTPERTNDSTIQPDKPEEEILRGFHGG